MFAAGAVVVLGVADGFEAVQRSNDPHLLSLYCATQMIGGRPVHEAEREIRRDVRRMVREAIRTINNRQEQGGAA